MTAKKKRVVKKLKKAKRPGVSVARLEKRILSAVKWAKKNGWNIATQLWGAKITEDGHLEGYIFIDDRKERVPICPLSCLAIKEKLKDGTYDDVDGRIDLWMSRAIGIKKYQVNAFTEAYDHSSPQDETSKNEYERLGYRVRQKLEKWEIL